MNLFPHLKEKSPQGPVQKMIQRAVREKIKCISCRPFSHLTKDGLVEGHEISILTKKGNRYRFIRKTTFEIK